MATASDHPHVSVQEMKDDLSCCICYNLLREPKELDCPHIYCLQCLQDWVGKQSTIECPECRYISVVPKGGLVNLKTNLRLKTMVEKYADRIEKQKGVPICSEHEGERQHFFCVTCGTTVCHNCLVFNHPRPQHEIKELKVITKMRKSEIKVKMDRVQEEVKKAKEGEQKLSEAEMKLKAAKEKATKDIKKQVQDVMAKAEAKGDEMIERVEATCQQHMKILQENQHHTKERLTRLQNVHSATQNVVDTAADHVYMKQHASLVDKMEKLCVTQHEAPSSDYSSLCSYSGPCQMNSLCFGHAALYGNKLSGLKLVHEFGSFQKAVGTAATQTNLLAVVDYEATKTEVFSCNSGEFKSQFCLGSSSDGCTYETLVKPVSVAVTSEGKFCVTDTGSKVKIFSPSGRNESTFHSNGSGQITTTPDDKIITGNNNTHEIAVFQSVGENYKKMKTHKTGPYQINSIASNGKQIVYTTGSDGKVCAIDFETGQALWSLDIVFPLGICYEHKSNTLLIAGNAKKQGKFTIQQYCSTTGRLISRLATGLCNPYAMTVTHDNKLLVADRKTVKVYEIR